MDKYDADGDGKISREEFFEVHVETSAVQKYKPWTPQTKKLPTSIARDLKKLDESHDTAEIEELCGKIF